MSSAYNNMLIFESPIYIHSDVELVNYRYEVVDVYSE